MNFGDRLKAERVRLGYNQVDFGALAGVTKTTQFNYEKAERAPDLNYLDAVAKAGVDVLFVVTGARTPVPEEALTEGEAEVLEHYRTMSEQDREAVKRMTSALAESAARDEATQR